MGVYNGQSLQGVTEVGATTNIQSTFKNSSSNLAGLVCDVTDTGGFAKIQQYQLNGSNFMYVGTLFGINGFVNELNNSFFFGNANAANFYLINTATGQHSISVNGNVFNFNAGSLDIGAKNFLSTGVFSDGVTPVVSGHNHDGTGNNGAIIQHVTVDNGRALDTTYTNSLIKPILIYGCVQCEVKNAGDAAYVDCFTDNASPPTTLHVRCGADWTGASALADLETFYHNFIFVVQPSHKWLLTSNVVAGGVLTLLTLKETPL